MKLKVALVTSVAVLSISSSAWCRVADEKVERVAADKVAIAWTGTTAVDVYMADKADAGVTGGKLIADDNKKGRVEISVDPTARPYFYLVDSRDGAVTEVAERVLPLEQGSNFRDLGGYPAAGGKHVRWGMMFRSGGTPVLTDADLARIKRLALTDMVDLRSSEERVLAPSKIEDVTYTAIGYSMTRLMGPQMKIDTSNLGRTYRNMPTLLAPQLRALFAKLAEDGTTVVYNCSAGQDRTGFATALILSALGVPRDVIFADYHLSTTYRRPQFETVKMDPDAMSTPAMKYIASFQRDPALAKPTVLKDAQGHAFLEQALAEIDEKWGSVEVYLAKEVGVDRADIVKLRAKYLE